MQIGKSFLMLCFYTEGCTLKKDAKVQEFVLANWRLAGSFYCNRSTCRQIPMKSCCLTTLSLYIAYFGLQWSLLPVLSFRFSYNLLFQKKGRTWKNLLYQFADQREYPHNDQPKTLWPSLLLCYQRLWRGAKKGWLITRDWGDSARK